MRESRTYGSVRGALSNERPYRDFSLFPPPPPHRTLEREFVLVAGRPLAAGAAVGAV